MVGTALEAVEKGDYIKPPSRNMGQERRMEGREGGKVVRFSEEVELALWMNGVGVNVLLDRFTRLTHRILVSRSPFPRFQLPRTHLLVDLCKFSSPTLGSRRAKTNYNRCH